MAMPLRVKEKSAWKTVKIPEDLLNSEGFDGLVDIQELNDYELVPFEADLDGDESLLNSKKSNKRKRKIQDVEETKPVSASNNDEGDSPQKVKRRKKRKNIGSSDETNENVGSDTGGAVVDVKVEDKNSALSSGSGQMKKGKKEGKNLSKLKKIDGKGGVFVKSENVLIVEDGTPDTGDSLAGKGPQNDGGAKVDSVINTNKKLEPVSKREKRKKKKLSRSETAENEEDSDALNVQRSTEASDKVADGMSSNSQSTKRKKRKRRKKKQQQNSSEVKEDGSSNENNNDEGKEGSSEEKRPKLDMSQWKNLYVPDVLLQALQDQRFDSPTTIQTLALPSAIRDRKDILGAAETGSGKTLAFGIPLLARILNSRKALQSQSDEEEQSEEEMELEYVDLGGQNCVANVKKKTPNNPPLALILEPTRELAVQVKKHLTVLAKHTDIKFATVVGGMSIEKQRRILGKKPHVVIATPGRLWQLIEEGNDHLSQVDKVWCLVVDEADRMVEKGHYEELTKLMEMMNKSPRRVKNRQTFVMSATLTMDVAAPKRLMNKMKKRVKDEDKLKTLTERIGLGPKPKVIDLTPKDKVAQTLTELRVNCKADEKDFYLYYFLCQHPGRTLVFANSKDCLRRLVAVLTLLQCSPLPLHADMHQRQRLKNLDRFSENDRGLLVASDVAARGLDIPNVDHVIHYQVPRTMENYVHRSGRTARASNLGLSVMLVGPEDAKDYRKIVSGVRNGEELPLLPVEMDLLPAVKQRVGLARDVDVREYRIKKKRLRNNFFTRAAQEMDMIVDDKNLLEDMGDSVEQAQDKQQLRQMKAQLASLLRGSLTPLRKTKYPTKSGQLATKQIVDLHRAR